MGIGTKPPPTTKGSEEGKECLTVYKQVYSHATYKSRFVWCGGCGQVCARVHEEVDIGNKSSSDWSPLYPLKQCFSLNLELPT